MIKKIIYFTTIDMSSPTKKRVNKQWLNPSFTHSEVSRQTLKRYKETYELAARSVSGMLSE